jgi:hypothetical protein
MELVLDGKHVMTPKSHLIRQPILARKQQALLLKALVQSLGIQMEVVLDGNNVMTPRSHLIRQPINVRQQRQQQLLHQLAQKEKYMILRRESVGRRMQMAVYQVRPGIQ